MNVTYLAHHGVKGMKWGVRHYQNKDGSLTNAGRKHYGYDVKTQVSESDYEYDPTRKKKVKTRSTYSFISSKGSRNTTKKMTKNILKGNSIEADALSKIQVETEKILEKGSRQEAIDYLTKSLSGLKYEAVLATSQNHTKVGNKWVELEQDYWNRPYVDISIKTKKGNIDVSNNDVTLDLE